MRIDWHPERKNQYYQSLRYGDMGYESSIAVRVSLGKGLEQYRLQSGKFFSVIDCFKVKMMRIFVSSLVVVPCHSIECVRR